MAEKQKGQDIMTLQILFQNKDRYSNITEDAL
jgi:hypothetical protein